MSLLLAKELEELRLEYQDKKLSLEDFKNIFHYISAFDYRCHLEQDAVQGLYCILSSKMNGEVTYDGFETMLKEVILLDNCDSLQQNRQNQLNIIIQDLTLEDISLIKELYSCFQPVHGKVSLNMINGAIHQEQQRLCHIPKNAAANAAELYSLFFGHLVDDNQCVNQQIFCQFIGEIEKIIYEKNQTQNIGGGFKTGRRPGDSKSSFRKTSNSNSVYSNEEIMEVIQQQQQQQQQEGSLEGKVNLKIGNTQRPQTNINGKSLLNFNYTDYLPINQVLIGRNNLVEMYADIIEEHDDYVKLIQSKLHQQLELILKESQAAAIAQELINLFERFSLLTQSALYKLESISQENILIRNEYAKVLQDNNVLNIELIGIKEAKQLMENEWDDLLQKHKEREKQYNQLENKHQDLLSRYCDLNQMERQKNLEIQQLRDKMKGLEVENGSIINKNQDLFNLITKLNSVQSTSQLEEEKAKENCESERPSKDLNTLRYLKNRRNSSIDFNLINILQKENGELKEQLDNLKQEIYQAQLLIQDKEEQIDAIRKEMENEIRRKQSEEINKELLPSTHYLRVPTNSSNDYEGREKRWSETNLDCAREIKSSSFSFQKSSLFKQSFTTMHSSTQQNSQTWKEQKNQILFRNAFKSLYMLEGTNSSGVGGLDHLENTDNTQHSEASEEDVQQQQAIYHIKVNNETPKSINDDESIRQKQLVHSDSEPMQKDYLNLLCDSRIKKILELEVIQGDQCSAITKPTCYIDSVFFINISSSSNSIGKAQKFERIILITDKILYILKPDTQLSVAQQIKIQDINIITFNQQMINQFIVYSMQNESEKMHLESFRRLEISLFILTVMKNRGFRPFIMKFVNEQNLSQKLQAAFFLNSLHIISQRRVNQIEQMGFLSILGKVAVEQQKVLLWVKHFFILTAEGIFQVLTRQDNKDEPQLLVPLKNAKLHASPKEYTRSYCFKISYRDKEGNNSIFFVLASPSEAEYEDWIFNIRRLIIKQQQNQ